MPPHPSKQTSNIYILHLFPHIGRDLKRSKQFIIAGFTQIEAVALAVLFRKVSPGVIHTENPFFRPAVYDSDLFSALIADDPADLFCLFYLIPAHTISSCVFTVFNLYYA